MWREGAQICRPSSSMPKKCLGFPGGALIYEVRTGSQGGALSLGVANATAVVVTAWNALVACFR